MIDELYELSLDTNMKNMIGLGYTHQGTQLLQGNAFGEANVG